MEQRDRPGGRFFDRRVNPTIVAASMIVSSVNRSFQGKQFRLRCRSRLLISTWTTFEYGLFSNSILAPLK